jgi:hypothetical protein
MTFPNPNSQKRVTKLLYQVSKASVVAAVIRMRTGPAQYQRPSRPREGPATWGGRRSFRLRHGGTGPTDSLPRFEGKCRLALMMCQTRFGIRRRRKSHERGRDDQALMRLRSRRLKSRRALQGYRWFATARSIVEDLAMLREPGHATLHPPPPHPPGVPPAASAGGYGAIAAWGSRHGSTCSLRSQDESSSLACHAADTDRLSNGPAVQPYADLAEMHRSAMDCS